MPYPADLPARDTEPGFPRPVGAPACRRLVSQTENYRPGVPWLVSASAPAPGVAAGVATTIHRRRRRNRALPRMVSVRLPSATLLLHPFPMTTAAPRAGCQAQPLDGSTSSPVSARAAL